MQHTVDILYILSSFYDKVYITKPHTSRYANSEKYIVCKDFLFATHDPFYPFLHDAFKKMMDDDSMKVQRFLTIPISYYFLIRLEEFNSIFGQQQIETIFQTISLIENKYKQEKIDSLVKINVQKCIQWCSKHNIACHNFVISNMFISEEDP